MKYAIKKNVVSINEKSGRPNEMRHGTCSKYLKSILMSILKLYEKEKKYNNISTVPEFNKENVK